MKSLRFRFGGMLAHAPCSSTNALIQSVIIHTGKSVNKVRVLAFDIRPCDAQTAQLLGIKTNDKVRYIERVLSTQQGPLGYAKNYLPLPMGEQVQRADLQSSFLREVLTDKYGFKFAMRSKHISPIAARRSF